MNILLCIKPVNDRKSYVDSSIIINPYDLHALNYLIGLKDKYDIKIKCLSMGPVGAENILRRCLAYGADEAVLITDRQFSGADTYSTSYLLAEVIKSIGDYDYIVCGKKSIDGETGQVPYGLAERLGITCISCVTDICQIEPDKLYLNRNMNDNIEYLCCSGKVLLSFYDFSIKEESISLLKLKMAHKKEIKIIDVSGFTGDIESCGSKGSRTKVLHLEKKLSIKEKEFISGTDEEIADKILQIIKREGVTKREL